MSAVVWENLIKKFRQVLITFPPFKNNRKAFKLKAIGDCEKVIRIERIENSKAPVLHRFSFELSASTAVLNRPLSTGSHERLMERLCINDSKTNKAAKKNTISQFIWFVKFGWNKGQNVA